MVEQIYLMISYEPLKPNCMDAICFNVGEHWNVVRLFSLFKSVTFWHRFILVGKWSQIQSMVSPTSCVNGLVLCIL